MVLYLSDGDEMMGIMEDMGSGGFDFLFSFVHNFIYLFISFFFED